MKVIELLNVLREMPLIAEVTFSDEQSAYAAPVRNVELMHDDGLPPVCYLGPEVPDEKDDPANRPLTGIRLLAAERLAGVD